jgi:hypothetical protein
VGADLAVAAPAEDYLGRKNPDALVGARLDPTSPGEKSIREPEDAHVIAMLDGHEREKTRGDLLVLQVADVDHEDTTRNVLRESENRK